MRISLLLNREPFGEILERTLSDFLENFYQKSFSVKWHSGRLNGSGSRGGQEWVCNPYINAIFIPDVERKALLPVINEFSRSLIRWQMPLQKGYVELAANRFFCRHLAKGALYIFPGIPDPQNLCFLGGNHHIRLIDCSKGVNYVIKKNGFDSRFITNELKVRAEHEFLPTPRILDVGPDGSWYCEEMIVGTPINRLKNPDMARDTVGNILPLLFKLYEDTAFPFRTADYVLQISDRLGSGLKNNSILPDDVAENLVEISKSLEKIVIRSSGKEIVLLQTHGDFQPANILAGDHQNWLIDWEYTAMRQPAYDSLVFALQSRHPLGFGNRFKRALSGDDTQLKTLFFRNPFIKWNEASTRESCLALFLLEEMDLKLMEIGNPLFTRIDSGFYDFINEAESSLNSMA